MKTSTIVRIHERLAKTEKGQSLVDMTVHVLENMDIVRQSFIKSSVLGPNGWTQAQARLSFTIGYPGQAWGKPITELNSFNTRNEQNDGLFERFHGHWTTIMKYLSSKMIDECFGKDKEVKTCNVEPAHIYNGRTKVIRKQVIEEIPGFYSWFCDNMVSSATSLRLTRASEYCSVRINEKMQNIVDGCEPQRLRALENFALHEIKEVLLRYSGVADNVIQRAFDEAIIHSVIDV